MQELLRLSAPRYIQNGAESIDPWSDGSGAVLDQLQRGTHPVEQGVRSWLLHGGVLVKTAAYGIVVTNVLGGKEQTRSHFEADDKRPFGAILKDCKAAGPDGDLVARLERFNEDRIDAIHKYLLGATDYEGMRAACVEHQGLDVAMRDWILKEVGVHRKKKLWTTKKFFKHYGQLRAKPIPKPPPPRPLGARTAPLPRGPSGGSPPWR